MDVYNIHKHIHSEISLKQQNGHIIYLYIKKKKIKLCFTSLKSSSEKIGCMNLTHSLFFFNILIPINRLK